MKQYSNNEKPVNVSQYNVIYDETNILQCNDEKCMCLACQKP